VVDAMSETPVQAGDVIIRWEPSAFWKLLCAQLRFGSDVAYRRP